MRRWEYKVLFTERNWVLGDTNVLNGFGESGWEAYAVQESGLFVYVYFKRELPVPKRGGK